MDNNALYKLSYGLYIVSSANDGKDAGCVVNTLQQVTNTPPRLSVAVNKENYTCRVIGDACAFSATVLTTGSDMNMIRTFGFANSGNKDKFAGRNTLRDGLGMPYLAEDMAARFSCRVTGSLDAGSHTIFLAEIVESEVLGDGEVMTYTYYQTVKKGLTPPKASSYQAPKGKASSWRCMRCGYVYEGDALPAGYVCPVCGAPAAEFERV